MKRRVNPDEIKVTENPDETGSFFVGLQCERFITLAQRRACTADTAAAAAIRRIAGPGQALRRGRLLVAVTSGATGARSSVIS